MSTVTNTVVLHGWEEFDAFDDKVNFDHLEKGGDLYVAFNSNFNTEFPFRVNITSRGARMLANECFNTGHNVKALYLRETVNGSAVVRWVEFVTSARNEL